MGFAIPVLLAHGNNAGDARAMPPGRQAADDNLALAARYYISEGDEMAGTIAHIWRSTMNEEQDFEFPIDGPTQPDPFY